MARTPCDEDGHKLPIFSQRCIERYSVLRKTFLRVLVSLWLLTYISCRTSLFQSDSTTHPPNTSRGYSKCDRLRREDCGNSGFRMELNHIRMIGFAVGVLIVGLQTVLIARQWRQAHGVERRKVLECG